MKFWRFMPFHKFLDVIVHHRLYFPSQYSLRTDDAYEGFFAWPDVEGLPAESDPSAPRAATDYVNCWHASEVEPAGLWKQYSDPAGGIAIVTDRERVVGAFSDSKETLVPGMIEYNDTIADSGVSESLASTVFRKRKHFATEQELRIWIPGEKGAIEYNRMTDEFFSVNPNGERSQIPSGKSVKCNLDVLIEKIVVGPKTEPWIFDAVKSLLEKLGLSFSLGYSEVARRPH